MGKECITTYHIHQHAVTESLRIFSNQFLHQLHSASIISLQLASKRVYVNIVQRWHDIGTTTSLLSFQAHKTCKSTSEPIPNNNSLLDTNPYQEERLHPLIAHPHTSTHSIPCFHDQKSLPTTIFRRAIRRNQTMSTFTRRKQQHQRPRQPMEQKHHFRQQQR